MLKVDIPQTEYFDDDNQEFVLLKGQSLSLEHSLVSISKWESKWHKPFLNTAEKTEEEVLDYIRCMTLTQNVDPRLYLFIPDDIFRKINAYIEDPMTATTINDRNSSPSRKIITSEVIYSWMIELGIPVEFQKWHLNRLLTLIKVCQVQKSPPKKMSKADIYSQNRQLNALRRAQMQSKG